MYVHTEYSLRGLKGKQQSPLCLGACSYFLDIRSGDYERCNYVPDIENGLNNLGRQTARAELPYLMLIRKKREKTENLVEK